MSVMLSTHHCRYISLINAVEIVSVAICLGSNHILTGLFCFYFYLSSFLIKLLLLSTPVFFLQNTFTFNSVAAEAQKGLYLRSYPYRRYNKLRLVSF